MKVETKYLYIAGLLTGYLFAGTVAAESDSRYQWGEHSDEKIMPGDIVMKSDDGTRKVAKVLGAPLGKEVIDGVEVGLYILQAANPARLQPGAKGPTHLFNVSMKPEDGGRLIKQAMGAVVIEGNGEVQRASFKPIHSHFQAEARLEEIGEYQISVEYVIEGGEGKTAGYPFNYNRKPSPYRHDHHGSHGKEKDAQEETEEAQHDDHSQHH